MDEKDEFHCFSFLRLRALVSERVVVAVVVVVMSSKLEKQMMKGKK